MKKIILFSLFLSFGCSSIQSKTPVNKDVTVTWLTNYKEKLWGFDFINENEVLITTKKGKVSRFNLKTQKKEFIPINFTNLYVGAQGGLLDVLKHNENYYFSYSYKNQKGKTTALLKSDLKGNDQLFYIANAYSNSGRHYGSRFLVKGDKLFATIGDRGQRERAQSLKYDNGKILTFDIKSLKNKEVYTLGHRNPQGITYHPEWKALINGEFGPQGGDELNLLKKGKNYGWPLITYGEEYGGGRIGKKKMTGMQQPLKYWTPSLSFSGITFYLSDKVKEWKNSLFLACLGTTQLYRVVLNKNFEVTKEESLLSHLGERIRNVRQSPDGNLYIITDSGKFGRVDKNR